MESQGSSATTVLVTVVIIVLIAAGVYFGFVKGRQEAPADNNGAGIEIKLEGGAQDDGGGQGNY